MLVDTSAWSLALRRNPKDLNDRQIRTLHRLQEVIAEGRAKMLGLVRQELLSGVRHREQFERLRIALRAFEDVEISTEDHEDAAGITNRCLAAGVVGQSIDFLLCAVAVRRGWSILTLDADFQQIRKVVPVVLLDAQDGGL